VPSWAITSRQYIKDQAEELVHLDILLMRQRMRKALEEERQVRETHVNYGALLLEERTNARMRLSDSEGQKEKSASWT